MSTAELVARDAVIPLPNRPVCSLESKALLKFRFKHACFSVSHRDSSQTDWGYEVVADSDGRALTDSWAFVPILYLVLDRTNMLDFGSNVFGLII